MMGADGWVSNYPPQWFGFVVGVGVGYVLGLWVRRRRDRRADGIV